MASTYEDINSKLARIRIFTGALAEKYVQAIVESREGKKITPEYNASRKDEDKSTDVFNIKISRNLKVNSEFSQVAGIEPIYALYDYLCIDICIRASDGDEMVLEVWTLKLNSTSNTDMNEIIFDEVHSKMCNMLKSAVILSRAIPAYKKSRSQHKESYKIFYKIYRGPPNLSELGEKTKYVKIGELNIGIGELIMGVTYRMDMTTESKKPNMSDSMEASATGSTVNISDNSPKEKPMTSTEDEVDLTKPMKPGAFVDFDLLDDFYTQMTQEPKNLPEMLMSWPLVNKKANLDEKDLKELLCLSIQSEDKNHSEKEGEEVKESTTIEKPGTSGVDTAHTTGSQVDTTTVTTVTEAVDVPKPNNESDNYESLMMIPFAGGSPLGDLANFYKECLEARSSSDEWTDLAPEVPSIPTDSQSLSEQLKIHEDAVSEFEDMVASMYIDQEHGDSE